MCTIMCIHRIKRGLPKYGVISVISGNNTVISGAEFSNQEGGCGHHSSFNRRANR